MVFPQAIICGVPTSNSICCSHKPFYVVFPQAILWCSHKLCLYIIITIILWVVSIYSFIKHYTIIILNYANHTTSYGVPTSHSMWCSHKQFYVVFPQAIICGVPTSHSVVFPQAILWCSHKPFYVVFPQAIICAVHRPLYMVFPQAIICGVPTSHSMWDSHKQFYVVLPQIVSIYCAATSHSN